MLIYTQVKTKGGLDLKNKAYTFKDLVGLKSQNGYTLEVKRLGNDYISAIIYRNDEYHYLSTHTFYGGHPTNCAQKILDKCGFNVELVDFETQKELKIGIYKEECYG